MPYPKRKRYSRRKRSYRRKNNSWSGWFQKHMTPQGVVDLAKEAALGMVKLYTNTERKYFDVAPSANTMLGTNPTSDCLTLIPLGDGPSSREGRQVKATSLFIRGILALNASNNSDIARVLVVQARTNAVPAINTILTSQNTIAPRNMNNVRDYTVLYDNTFNLDKEKNDKVQFKIPIKLNNKLQYNVSDTTGQASPVWGAIYLMVFARETSNESSFLYWSRLRYIDN